MPDGQRSGMRHWTLVLDEPGRGGGGARAARRGAARPWRSARTASSRGTAGTTRWSDAARDRRNRSHRRARRARGRAARPSAACAQRLVVRDPARAPADRRAPRSSAAPRTPTARRCGAPSTAPTRSSSCRPTRTATASDLHRGAVDAAVAAGVERIVYTSFAAAAPDTVVHVRARPLPHRGAHQGRRRCGWTFLRDNIYLDFMPFFAGEDGVIRGPGRRRPGGRGGPRRHRRRRPRRCWPRTATTGATYVMTGPESLTLARGGRAGRPGRRAAGDLRARDARGGARVARAERRCPTGRSRAGSPHTPRSRRASWSPSAGTSSG